MYKQLCFSAALSIAFLTAGHAYAEAPGKEKSHTWTYKDPQLKWGPCPAFMPEGCAIAVLHGDPAKDNVDVFLQVPAGSTIPPHWHTSAERMILVSGTLQVNYDGQEESILQPGTYAYGPAKLPHKASCTGGESCVLFIAFESPLDAVPVEGASK